MDKTMEKLCQELEYHVFAINCDYGCVYFMCDCENVGELDNIDIAGAIEETLHYLLDSGLSVDEICTAMGLSYDYDNNMIDHDDEQVCYIDCGYYIYGTMWSFDMIA